VTSSTGGFKILINSLDTTQNRELQIMRLVSHPNVVDLKAFFYSNGDKVSHTAAFRLATRVKIR
jgi:serine/threonine protein kinase